MRFFIAVPGMEGFAVELETAEAVASEVRAI